MILLDTLVTVALLVGMPLTMEAGRRVARARMARGVDVGDGVGALDAAVYGLFSLLLAFTFSGALGRFDTRRQLILQETNAIGTAWLRLDLLPAARQGELRALFRSYVDARIETCRSVETAKDVDALLRRDGILQGRIWTLAVSGALESGNPGVITSVTAALNDMFDITTTRLGATRTHPPGVIYVMLVLLAVAASGLAGMSTARSAQRPKAQMAAFVLAIVATVFVTLDIEYPRAGLIRVDDADALMVELRAGMAADAPGATTP